MKRPFVRFVVRHPRIVVLAAVLVLFLTIGAVGEVAAHNPAGQPVPGCENGADVVAAKNPNCHG